MRARTVLLSLCLVALLGACHSRASLESQFFTTDELIVQANILTLFDGAMAQHTPIWLDDKDGAYRRFLYINSQDIDKGNIRKVLLGGDNLSYGAWFLKDEARNNPYCHLEEYYHICQSYHGGVLGMSLNMKGKYMAMLRKAAQTDPFFANICEQIDQGDGFSYVIYRYVLNPDYWPYLTMDNPRHRLFVALVILSWAPSPAPDEPIAIQ